MGTTKNFSDATGTAQRLIGNLQTVKTEIAKARWPMAKLVRADSFTVWAGLTVDGILLPVTRSIRYSLTPSKHRCDARCINAKGHNCECACGGKHHGKGGE